MKKAKEFVKRNPKLVAAITGAIVAAAAAYGLDPETSKQVLDAILTPLMGD